MQPLILTIPLMSAVMLASFALPMTALAHDGAGLTFTATSTNESGRQFIVDIDYRDAAIEAGRIGRFDFNLFTDAERTKPADFTDMWIRIQKDEGTRDDGGRSGKTVFAGAVARQEFGGDGFSFLFSEGGPYVLSVRYNDAGTGAWGETVAEAEFPLTVLRGADEDTFKFASEFWVGLIAGICIALLGSLPLLMRANKS